jgi:hypothetical protein
MVDINTRVEKTANKILSAPHHILANIEQQQNKKSKGDCKHVLA